MQLSAGQIIAVTIRPSVMPNRSGIDHLLFPRQEKRTDFGWPQRLYTVVEGVSITTSPPDSVPPRRNSTCNNSTKI
jgi:hypothetical protein